MAEYKLDSENMIMGLAVFTLVMLIVVGGYIAIYKLKESNINTPTIDFNINDAIVALIWFFSAVVGLLSITTGILFFNTIGEIFNKKITELGEELRQERRTKKWD